MVVVMKGISDEYGEGKFISDEGLLRVNGPFYEGIRILLMAINMKVNF